MKIVTLNIPAAGTWARDCELISLTDDQEFKIIYYRDEDYTYWSLLCEGVVAYKVVSEEFSWIGCLGDLPEDGAFFEILDSPWIEELGRNEVKCLDKCKHYVLEFYEEKIEILAQNFIFNDPFVLDDCKDCSKMESI